MTQRTILFRGKSVKNGQWVEGDLIQSNDQYNHKTLIWPINTSTTDNMVGVDPATVGQFTGIEKDGIKMFEGDLVSSNGRVWVVRYKQDKYHIGWIATDEKQLSYVHIWYDDMKVVGNIFDNPELLTK